METTRRELLRAATFAGAASALAVPVLAQQNPPADATMANATPTDAAPMASADVLRNALRVEQAKAAFYAQALQSHQTRAFLPENMVTLVRAIAAEETAHVAAVQTLLATDAPASGPTFQFPYATMVSPVAFGWFAHTLEEIAIGSHLSTLKQVPNAALTRAVSDIIASGSRHAALLRQMSGFDPAPLYYESPIAPADVDRLLAPYIV